MPAIPENQSVTVIGNLNIDLIIRDVPGMPAWGQEVFGSSRLQVSSGQAGYLAFALRRLGIPTRLIANVGEALYGQQILNDLRAFGADTGGVQVTSGGNTGITVAMVRADGERAFVSDLGCLQQFTEENIQQNWPLTGGAGLVCLVGLFCLPGLSLQAAAGVFEKMRGEGKLTMLDTGWDVRNWPDETLAGMRTLLKQFLSQTGAAHAGQDDARQYEWRVLFVAGMWFQDLFNYDFRRTEMCIIPYGTQLGEISFCAYNTGVGWRNIIEKMKANATVAEWYRRHGRHRGERRER